MTFGKRLRYVLIDHGMPHIALSRSTGISPANVSHLLAGRKPSYMTLCKILRALPATVNIRELILGERS